MKLLLGFVLRASDNTLGKQHAVRDDWPANSVRTERRSLCGIAVTLSARHFSEARFPCKRCAAAARRLQLEEP